MNKVIATIAWCLSALMLTSSFSSAQNNTPAAPDPRNLAEAAGQYAGAAMFTRYVKLSPCGFAVTREAPALNTVIRSDIAFRFPSGQQDYLFRELMNLEPLMIKQSEEMFRNLYSHYTTRERLDHRTACGLVAGAAISMQKLTKGSMDRMTTR